MNEPYVTDWELKASTVVNRALGLMLFTSPSAIFDHTGECKLTLVDSSLCAVQIMCLVAILVYLCFYIIIVRCQCIKFAVFLFS